MLHKQNGFCGFTSSIEAASRSEAQDGAWTPILQPPGLRPALEQHGSLLGRICAVVTGRRKKYPSANSKALSCQSFS